MEKYEEFRKYDAKCREEGVLFFKLLFVSDKDSIAATLGKRLAHKQIVRDLHTWLDANSVHHVHEGLEQIEKHIDPTDFVAFNKYKDNLHTFTEFARNTDATASSGPWTVVSTSKRHPARQKLLQAFERSVKMFAARSEPENLEFHRMRKLLSGKEDPHGHIPLQAIMRMLMLLALVFFYAYITWKVDFLGIVE